MDKGLISFDKATGRSIFWLILGGLLVLGAFIIAPFMNAILWAVVLGTLIYPYYRRLRDKSKWPANLAATWVTVLVGLAIILPFIGFGLAAGVQAYGYASNMLEGREDGPVTMQSVSRELDKAIEPLRPTLASVGLEDFNAQEWLDQNRDQIGDLITGPITNGLTSLVITIVTLVIALLSMFFFVRDGHRMRDPACAILPIPKEESMRIFQRMGRTIHSVFIGVVLVALIQGILATIAYAIAGVNGFWVWGLITTVFCMIPLLGSPVIYVPLSLLMFAQGHTWQGFFLLGFGFLIISNVDNLLRPFFIGAGTGLHPIAVFFSLLGGVLVFGPIGLMAGPMVLTGLMAFADIIITRRRMEDAVEERPGNEPFGIGDRVSWQFGYRTERGMVKEVFFEEVTRKVRKGDKTLQASREEPAYLVEMKNGDLTLHSHRDLRLSRSQVKAEPEPA